MPFKMLLTVTQAILVSVHCVPKNVHLQYTGEVGKCTSYWCQIFSGFNAQNIIKIGSFLTELFEE